MRPVTTANVLQLLRPNAAFVIRGGEIEWFDDRPQPTREEIEAAWPLAKRAAAEREVRAERDRLLAACDWTQVNDAPVDASAWAAYRQALRDVPAQVGFPEAVEWPVAPDAGV